MKKLLAISLIFISSLVMAQPESNLKVHTKDKGSFIVPSSISTPSYSRKAAKAMLYTGWVYNQTDVSSEAKMSELMIFNYDFVVRKLSMNGAIEEEHLHTLFNS